MTTHRVPLRRLFRVVNGGTPTAESENWDGPIEWATPVDLGLVDGGYLGSTQRTLTEVGLRAGSAAVPPGSLIVSTRAPIGYVAETRSIAAFNQGCRGLVPTTQLDQRFFRYVLESSSDLLQAHGQGSTFKELSTESLASITVPVPSFAEQRAIADFLDAEIARIDRLVSARQDQAVLLVARWASAVDSALSSGDVVGLPSLSVAVSIAEGQVDPTDFAYATTPLIAPNHVESGTGRLLELVTAAEQGATSGKYLCRAGDVVYSKIRPALRKACIAPAACLTSADMYPMSPNGELSADYLLYFLLSDRYTDFAVMESERVAMPKINRDAFGRIRIPLKSAAQQAAIVGSLHALADRAFVGRPPIPAVPHGGAARFAARSPLRKGRSPGPAAQATTRTSTFCPARAASVMSISRLNRPRLEEAGLPPKKLPLRGARRCSGRRGRSRGDARADGGSRGQPRAGGLRRRQTRRPSRRGRP